MWFKGLFKRNCSVLEKTDNSITFRVERFLPKPRQKLFFYDGAELEDRLQSDNRSLNSKKHCITSSFHNETLGYVGSDVLYKCMINAFADHRQLILSPDMIWLVLCQAFSHHIKLNHKKYRSRIVNHQRLKALKVVTSIDLFDKNADWTNVLNGFYDEIDKNTKNNFASIIKSDFSTTSINERIASIITLMDITKHFFTFEALFMICGIPKITLEGKPEDWEKILSKLKLFDQFGLNQWALELKPIIQEFINTAKGSPDLYFWRTMIKRDHAWLLKGPTCSYSSNPTKLDGWFSKLFPFAYDGSETKESYYELSERLSEIVNVDFKYTRINPLTMATETFNLELFSGFVGVEENPETKAIRPKIGWMVCKKEDKEDQRDCENDHSWSEDLSTRP